MKKFSDYLIPKPSQKISEQTLSISDKAWAKAKQKINERADTFKPHEPIIEIIQEKIEEVVTEEVLPELAPFVEEYVDDEVNPDDVQRLIESLTGPQGERGEKGDKGSTGEQGPKGDQGIPGIRGERGEDGPMGIKGDRGDVGPAGKDGAVGQKGDVGPQGATGQQGIPGKDGIDGMVGASGEKGDKGDQGDQGDVGPQGKDGQKGADGPKGNKGDQGERGDKGDKGDAGEQGPVGPVGPVGPKGADGKTPDIKKFAEKFDKLSQDINKRIDKTVQGINLTGGGSGSYWLNDLGDTDHLSVKNATNGQVLTFDSTIGKWTAADSTGGGGEGTQGRQGAQGSIGAQGYQGDVGPNYQNAYDQANLAFDKANTVVNYLPLVGGTLTGDLVVQGNISLSGSSTTYTSNIAVVSEPILYLAGDNPSDLVDIGFYGHFVGDGSSDFSHYQHTGLIRDYHDRKWKLFSNVSEPQASNSYVDFTNAIYDTLQVGTIEGSANISGGSVTANTIKVPFGVSGDKIDISIIALTQSLIS